MEDRRKEKISHLESQLGRISELITRADTKTAILLALLGVVIANALSKENLENLFSTFQLITSSYSPGISALLSIVIALPYLLLLAGLVFLVISLFAKITKKTAEIPSSNLFFRNIADFETLETFEESFSVTLNNLESELMTEILINSKICSSKYRLFNIGLILVAMGSIFLVIMQVILAV